jgi:membrane-associated phospholipid phosphatase
VDLVHHHPLQPGKDARRVLVADQQGQTFGRGQQDMRRIAPLAALLRIRGVAGPVLDTAFTGLMPPLLFVMLVAAVWWRWGRYPAALFLLAGSVTGLTKLADLARRPRPNDDLTWGEVVVGEGGYPSGHVVFTVMVFGMLTYLAARHVERPATRHLLSGGALVLIVVTGPSRMIEGDHWPADVVAGYTLAIAGLAGVIWIDRRLPAVLGERAPRVHRWLQLDR